MTKSSGGAGASLPCLFVSFICGFRRAMKLTLANEGREAAAKEAEVTERKRKAEDDQRWEGML